MTIETRNEVLLEGMASEASAFSHENHGVRFFRLSLRVPRLSGTPDILPVLLPEPLLPAAEGGGPLRVRGQLRSFNNRSGVGNRLVPRRSPPGPGSPATASCSPAPCASPPSSAGRPWAAASVT